MVVELKGEEQPRFGSREPSPRNLFSEDVSIRFSVCESQNLSYMAFESRYFIVR